MPAEIIEVGIDWLTGTAVPGPKAAQLFLWGAELLRTRQREHCKPERMTWQRYAGQYCGGVFLGDRRDGTVLRLSGDQAHRWWQPTVPLTDHISRLDTQVTWRTNTYDGGLGYRALSQAIKKRETGGHPFTITHTATYKGGFTLYLGSRSSDRFGRLYDKQHESNEEAYQRCWRYELELKQEQAYGCATAMKQATNPSAYCVQTVWDYFTEKGVSMPFAKDAGPGFRRVHVEPPDDEKRLSWLADSIVPVAEGLRQRGLGADVERLFTFTQRTAEES